MLCPARLYSLLNAELKIQQVTFTQQNSEMFNLSLEIVFFLTQQEYFCLSLAEKSLEIIRETERQKTCTMLS